MVKHNKVVMIYSSAWQHQKDNRSKTVWDLNYWSGMTHICVSKLTIIGSDNGWSPGGHQVIIWINAETLFIWPVETQFNEISIKYNKKMRLKTRSTKCRPCCFGLNVLTHFLPRAAYALVNWISIDSSNGLSPIRRLAITWTNVHVLSIGSLRTYVRKIRVEIQFF